MIGSIQNEILKAVTKKIDDAIVEALTVRVSWSYWHYLNRKSRTRITKQGVYIRRVKHKNKPKHQLAVVSFDGNKNYSLVREDKLKFLECR